MSTKGSDPLTLWQDVLNMSDLQSVVLDAFRENSLSIANTNSSQRRSSPQKPIGLGGVDFEEAFSPQRMPGKEPPCVEKRVSLLNASKSPPATPSTSAGWHSGEKTELTPGTKGSDPLTSSPLLWSNSSPFAAAASRPSQSSQKRTSFSPQSLAEQLRQTPRGRLRYDHFHSSDPNRSGQRQEEEDEKEEEQQQQQRADSALDATAELKDGRRSSAAEDIAASPTASARDRSSLWQDVLNMSELQSVVLDAFKENILSISNTSSSQRRSSLQKPIGLGGVDFEEAFSPQQTPVEEPPCVEKRVSLLNASKSPPATPSASAVWHSSEKTELTPPSVAQIASPASPANDQMMRLKSDYLHKVEKEKARRRKRAYQYREELLKHYQDQLDKRLKNSRQEDAESKKRIEDRYEIELQEQKERAVKALKDTQKRRELQRLDSLKAAQELEELRNANRMRLAELMPKLTDATSQLESLITGGLSETVKSRGSAELKRAAAVLVEAQMAPSAPDAGNPKAVEELTEKVLSSVTAVKKVQAVIKAEEEARQKEQELADKQRQLEEEQRQKELEAKREQQVESAEVPLPMNRQQSPAGVTASPANVTLFEDVLRFKKEFTAQVQTLEGPIKAACQKAINVPVNCINNSSSDHLKGMLEKLRNLLGGREVEISGGKRFSAAASASGIPFCKTLLASKLCSQAQKVLSTKPKYNFYVALVVNTLWSEHPDFGKLFLGSLFEACPHLVPIQDSRNCLPEVETDGTVEDYDNFLKRMTGLAIVYAAICVTALPKKESAKDHPHGLGNLWRWLTSVMNQPPVTGITATLLYHVLETAGSELESAYGPLFLRLLHLLKEQYMPLIRSATDPKHISTYSRLEEFLKKHSDTGEIPRHPAALPLGFI